MQIHQTTLLARVRRPMDSLLPARDRLQEDQGKDGWWIDADLICRVLCGIAHSELVHVCLSNNDSPCCLEFFYDGCIVRWNVIF